MKPNHLLYASALTLASGIALASAPNLTNPGQTPGVQAMVRLAANADNPYGNVDHRNDAGNNTGDAKVDKLNSGQLGQNFKGPYSYRGVGSDAQAPTPASPGAAAVAPAR